MDATLGLGGHAIEIARRLGTGGRLVGLDRDAQALEIARAELVVSPDDASGWLHHAYALRRVSADGLSRAWHALLPAAEILSIRINVKSP